METSYFLIVDRGDPFRKGDSIPLTSNCTLIGRPCKTDNPDIAFNSLYVSRKHAALTRDREQCFITDLGSKHGTQVNGEDLEPNKPKKINDGDEITLAQGLITIVLKNELCFDDRTITMTNIFSKNPCPVTVDLERREVRIDGELLNFSGKDRELLFLLYSNRCKAMSYDDIKIKLWPERSHQPDSVPDVGTEELNALVYRLRKRLGKYGDRVITVARFGVLLDI